MPHDGLAELVEEGVNVAVELGEGTSQQSGREAAGDTEDLISEFVSAAEPLIEEGVNLLTKPASEDNASPIGGLPNHLSSKSEWQRKFGGSR